MTLENMQDVAWTPFNSDGTPDTVQKPKDDDNHFKEQKFSVSGFNTFTAFQLKIVMNRNN